jgi:menaquinone-dependent protoporphyrinogen oxidase
VRVLIVYGSRHDGTHGLADMIADALAERNFSTKVQPAGQFTDLADADAVIVAGAVYMGRWHRDAVRFVRHHAKTLRGLPLWLVSSGPLDDSAATREIPPVRQVVRLAASVGARGHVTFGGRLLPDTGGCWPAPWPRSTPGTGATPSTCAAGSPAWPPNWPTSSPECRDR